MKKRAVLSRGEFAGLFGGYLAVLAIIVAGFLVGRGYRWDDGHVAHLMPYSWNQKYGWEQLDEMFDGVIDQYEGWYGLSWENTYSFYQDTDMTREELEKYASTFSWPEGWAEWSEKEYVEYISDFSAYRMGDQDYVWITLGDKIVFVEFGPTNQISNYDRVVPKIIFSCVGLLLLPVICVAALKIVQKKKAQD